MRERDHGSCRDINLSEHLSHDASLKLLKVISAEWTLSSALDNDDVETSLDGISKRIGVGTGGMLTIWSGGSFLKRLRCYLYWNPTEGVFCELTFFPEDIIGSDPFVEKLTNFLRIPLFATRSSEYYVRFENASWRHGDVSRESGVIFSHYSLPLGGG